jgi:hypothetical protein
MLPCLTEQAVSTSFPGFKTSPLCSIKLPDWENARWGRLSLYTSQILLS